MTTELDLELPGDVVEILAELGQTVTLEYPRLAAIDPITRKPALATSPPTSASVRCSPIQRVTERPRGEAAVVQDADWETYLAAQGLTTAPVAGDAILDGAGARFKVLWVDPLRSGDLVAVYRVYLRR